MNPNFHSHDLAFKGTQSKKTSKYTKVESICSDNLPRHSNWKISVECRLRISLVFFLSGIVSLSSEDDSTKRAGWRLLRALAFRFAGIQLTDCASLAASKIVWLTEDLERIFLWYSWDSTYAESTQNEKGKRSSWKHKPVLSAFAEVHAINEACWMTWKKTLRMDCIRWNRT